MTEYNGLNSLILRMNTGVRDYVNAVKTFCEFQTGCYHSSIHGT